MNMLAAATTSGRTRLWPSVLVLALGYGAGMQLGKIAPLIPRMQAEASYSLTLTGWLTSLLGLFVALAAYPIAGAVSRLGAARSLKFGSVVLALGAVALGLSPAPALLLASRTIEAAGYVVVVIAAPAYLAAHSPQNARGVLMALWGSFVPAGYALASFQAAQLPSTWTIGTVLLSFAIPIAVLSLLAILIVRAAPAHVPERRKRARVSGAGILTALAFGLYVYLSIGFFTFLPRYLASLPQPPSVSPSLVALCVPVGNVAAAILLGFLGARFARHLAIAAFLGAAVAGGAVFVATGSHNLVMPLFAISGGLAASSLFASVAISTRDEVAATSLVGAIAQAGGIATLLGPPVAGYLAEVHGWTTVGISFALIGLLAAVALAQVSNSTLDNRVR